MCTAMLAHQLATRLYMDFLRMESEFNFLALLPQNIREEQRDIWYREVDKSIKGLCLRAVCLYQY